eukprot:CAMPEP_0116145190 /NCGR_PEP_ID=MMETSP0329-20121206/16442_1 /TAXON_ID=697910 /ORGANISM="Pseudo-nitzschia arenysensis, Strain B593" /LENGTH=343 /DNA_ID=CAMNT_0003640741 /DNA_START=149 /DNA_END=1177 /DNA_ORIENTATION=+
MAGTPRSTGRKTNHARFKKGESKMHKATCIVFCLVILHMALTFHKSTIALIDIGIESPISLSPPPPPPKARKLEQRSFASRGLERSWKSVRAYQMPPNDDEYESETSEDDDRPPINRLLVIGASEGYKGNENIINHYLKQSGTNAMLVEAAPDVFEKLKATVKEKYDETLERIVPFKGLACEKGQQGVLYYPDIDKLHQAMKTSNELPFWILYMLAKRKRSDTEEGLSHFFSLRKSLFPDGVQASDFIKEDSMDCISIQSIIANSHMDATDIGVLVMNADGYDPLLLLDSFKIPGLDPDTVLFDWRNSQNRFPEEASEVMNTLLKRGYNIDSFCRKNGAGGTW